MIATSGTAVEQTFGILVCQRIAEVAPSGARGPGYSTVVERKVKDAHERLESGKNRTQSVDRRTDARGTAFLRTVEAGKLYSYRLVYKDSAAALSIWILTIPANGQSPEMEFSTIDGRDFTDQQNNKRNVTVTLRVGPATTPYFQGVIAFGSHILQK